MKSYYKPGTWNVICDVCGFQFKSDELRKRWDGLYVCTDDYESRHILEFFRGCTETSRVTYTRPEPPPIFVEVHYLDGPPVVVPTPPPVVVPPVEPPPPPPPPPPPVEPPPDAPPVGADLSARADYARANYAQADRAI